MPEKSGISVSDGKITGVDNKTDVAALLESLEGGRYLRVYDEKGA